MSDPKTHKRVKSHIRYELKDGTYVPGITTVCGLLHKGALVPWSNKLGLQGIEVGKFVDELADIGSLAHDFIQATLKGEVFDDGQYTNEQKSAAEVCINKFLDWKTRNKVKPILVEQPTVSEKYKYGGTLDLYAEVNGKKTLIDWKTGSGFYKEHKLQLSANRNLLFERGLPVEECMLVGIGRSEKEDFHVLVPGNMDRRFEMFLKLLDVYRLDKEIGE